MFTRNKIMGKERNMIKIENYKIKKSNEGYYKGYYIVRFYYNEDGNRYSKRNYKISSKNKHETEANAKEYMFNFNNEYNADDPNVIDTVAIRAFDKPVCELIDEYLESCEKELHLRNTTMMDKKSIADNQLKKFYEDKKLFNINEDLMGEYKKYCFAQKNSKTMGSTFGGKSLSPRRIQKYWEANVTFMNWLCKKKYIKYNPTGKIERPKGTPVQQKVYWEKEEFAKFLSVIPKNTQDYVIFKLAFLTGMRQAELLGLTWNDLNLKELTVTINKQFCTKTHEVVNYTKTESSNRITKIPESLVGDLVRLKEAQMEKYGFNDYCPVFTDNYLGNLSAKTLANHYHKYIMESGVKKITFHQLRNSYITNMIDNGAEDTTVAEMVGHASVMTTKEVYKVTTMKHKNKANEVANKLAEGL